VHNTLSEEPETGTIVIEKDVNPEPDRTDFDFSDTIPSCSIGTLDDDGSAANPSSTPNSVTCSDVPAGQYQVTEAGEAGYQLVSIACSTSDASDTTTTSLSNRRATIDLDPGETVRCVFTNQPVEPKGSITIVKDTNPETTAVLFDFDSADFGDFDLLDDGSKTFSGLSPDDYLFRANEPAGWRLVDVDCDSAGVSISLATNTLVVHLDAGENVTCVFTNVPEAQGSITIVKDTEPSTTNVLFDFYSARFGEFALYDTGSATFGSLTPGTYAVTENPPTGWRLTDITCTSSAVVESISTRSVSIQITDGEHVTCVFLNVPVVVPAAPTPTATPIPTAVSPAGVIPPSTGDAGLADDSGPLFWVALAASIVTVALVVRKLALRDSRRDE
jgi:hypothetical protein